MFTSGPGERGRRGRLRWCSCTGSASTRASTTAWVTRWPSASLNAAARGVYSLGREGVLPGSFGRSHSKFKTPHVAIYALAPVIGGVPFVMVAYGTSPLAIFGYQRPDQIAVLHDADDRGWRIAVEELLRWTTPLHHFRRTATRDITLGQSKIAAGDKVVVWYTSANRDNNVFQDPYRLDLRRSPNPHTTFGRGGPHRCLGEHLARLELRVLLQELLPVLPRLEPDGKPARIRSNFTNGLKHLPVRIS